MLMTKLLLGGKNFMKTTENYEQLLQRFTKRVNQLETEQQELRAAYDRWIELDKQLNIVLLVNYQVMVIMMA